MNHNEILRIKNADSEKSVKEALTTWLQHYPCEVIDESRFRTDYGRGGMKSPDLLVKSNVGAVLIEVKNAVHDSNVFDSFFQILNYHNNINTVTVDRHEKLDITGFVVATQFSMYGRLFAFETRIPYDKFRKGRQGGADRGELPRTEYDRTEMFTRLLWRGINSERPMFIGTLLSNVLNDAKDVTPMIIGSKYQNKKQFYDQVTG
jgi:hypothetical protein